MGPPLAQAARRATPTPPMCWRFDEHGVRTPTPSEDVLDPGGLALRGVEAGRRRAVRRRVERWQIGRHAYVCALDLGGKGMEGERQISMSKPMHGKP
jgi:hypothetical protein